MVSQMTTLNPQTLEPPKEGAQFKQIESFFDYKKSDTKSLRRLWTSPDQSHESEIKKNILVDGVMEKQGRKTHSWKMRYYMLTDDFLAYKEKPNSKKIKKVMSLERVKFETVELRDEVKKKVKYGLSFTKNQKCVVIYTSDQTLHQRFTNELEKRCILVNFDQNYDIEKLIGKGSFGKVYLVNRKSDNKKFAAKMFFKDALLKRQRGKDALVNEIRILRKLDHPGVMKMYQVYETLLGIFLIMELLEGGELFEHLKSKKTFTERDCALMLIKIIEPLVYMHSKGIAHRDIKPENLILRSRNDEFGIVIADFGLSQNLRETPIYIKCGSPGYCAPEILGAATEKIEYNSKCDVFSLGCVFYHMVTGQNPFWSKYVKETYSLNRTCDVNFEDPKILSLSPSGQDLLKKMLFKFPDRRPSMVECLDHYFFTEAFQIPKSPILRFGRKANRQMSVPRKSEELKEFASKSPFSIDLPEEGSFVIGRTNIMKGKTETLQEVSRTHRTREVKKNLLHFTLNDTNSPLKSGSLGFIHASGLMGLASKDESLTSSDVNLNESNEAGNFAQCEKPREILCKVNQVSTKGVLNNPFSEVIGTEKDLLSVKARGSLVTSDKFKQSLILQSQLGLSAKSEELANPHPIQIKVNNA